MKILLRPLFVILGLIVSITSLHAAAILEEVIVTAQKREQSLQDVGISITALDAGQIQNFRFVASTDVVAQLPGVENFSTQGRGANAFTYIRGVGLNDFGDAHEAPVTGYVDDFYMLAPAGLDFALYDLERIEVLRGPQGTLFGRNSTGGLIHYISKKPTKEFEGYIDATYASYDEVRVEGVVSGPLSENLSGRASLLFHDGDGYIKNLGPFKDGSDYGTKAGRVQLLYEPNDDVSMLAKIQYGDVNVIPLYTDHETARTDPLTGLQELNPGGVSVAGFNESQVGASAKRTVRTNNPQTLESEVLNVLFRIDWNLNEEISLTSLSGYAWVTRDNREDCDGSPQDVCAAGFPVDHDIITQEVKLYWDKGNTRWTGGVFYLDQDAQAHPNADFFGFPLALNSPWELQLESWSVYGHIEYDIAPQWTILAGVRYTNDKKHYEAVNTFFGAFRNDADNFTDANVGDFTNRKDELVSANFEVDWKPNEDWLVYAKITRGTKAGGFNNGFYNVPTPADVQFGDETLLSYETGFKADIFNNRARLNASFFYYDYKDFQTFNFSGLSGSVTNSDAVNFGTEVELLVFPTDQLEISLGLSLLDSTVKDVFNGVIVSDVRMALAPKVTFNGMARYTQLAFNGGITYQWDFNYASNKFNNNFNDLSSAHGEVFTTNIRATYVPNSAKWEASFFVQNLTDETNLIKADPFGGLGFRQGVYGPPRWFGGSVRLNF
jgi:iron complex outermembrane receptor protein